MGDFTQVPWFGLAILGVTVLCAFIGLGSVIRDRIELRRDYREFSHAYGDFTAQMAYYPSSGDRIKWLIVLKVEADELLADCAAWQQQRFRAERFEIGTRLSELTFHLVHAIDVMEREHHQHGT